MFSFPSTLYCLYRFLVPGWRMGWIIIHDRQGVFERAGVSTYTDNYADNDTGTDTYTVVSPYPLI
jgi:hypothetical protein